MIAELEAVKALVHAFSFSAFSALLIPVALFSLFFYILAFTALLAPKKHRLGRSTPAVTIQIPTRNEIVALRCAERCLSLDYPKNRYEILIGDDSSDATISAALDSFARKQSQVRIIRRGSNKGFKAGNLNNMTRHSKGEIIVVFDSDFVPDKDFLRRIVAPFADPKIACVQAKWSYLNMRQSMTAKFASTILMVYHRLLAKLNDRHGVALLFGSGQAVRKDVLQKLGGWQEGSVTEDVEFSVRALSRGYRTAYLNGCEVAGEVPFAMRGLRTQQKRWAYGNLRAFLDHKRAILAGKTFSPAQKLLLMATLLGYFASFFLVAFMFFGVVSFATGEAGPISVPFLAADLAKNFLAASGFIFAGIVVLAQEKKLHLFPQVFIASLTVGILVACSVSRGVFAALTRKPMPWIIIAKTGNEQAMMRLPSPHLTPGRRSYA